MSKQQDLPNENCQNEKILYGRIMQYSLDDGYGFIYTEDGYDVFFSSYNFVSRREEKHASVGAIVKFIIAYHNGKKCADQIVVKERFPAGKIIMLPNGLEIELMNLRKFGISSGNVALKRMGISKNDLLEHGHSVSDCRYLFFSSRNDIYRFFPEKSFINGDGQCDIDIWYANLKERFLLLY